MKINEQKLRQIIRSEIRNTLNESVRNNPIFQNIMDAMQKAEEMGGPQDQEYVELMRAVADEAKQRIRNFRRMNL